MRKNTILISIAVVLFFMFLMLAQYMNNMEKARFVLHALSRYVHAYELVEKKPIRSLNDLPYFHLVSYPSSFQVTSDELRSRVIDGYYYDFHQTGPHQFVMSASPLRVYPFSKEFGITEDMNLRVNSYGVDSTPDSRDEVKKWPILPEWFEIKTFPESS